MRTEPTFALLSVPGACYICAMLKSLRPLPLLVGLVALTIMACAESGADSEPEFVFVPTVTSTVGPATPVPTPVAQKPSDDGPKLPDLLVTAVVWEPTVPTMGEDVQVIVTIENNGTLAADKTLLQFLVQERTTAEAALARLDPGETVTQKFVWEAASGVDTIGAFVDPENVVEESNETNNRVNINFGGVTAADLAIRNIVWEPEDPDVGDKLDSFVKTPRQAGARQG